MSERCPKCGKRVGLVGHWLGPIMSHEPNDNTCLRNQLTTANARIAELEAEVERLKTEKSRTQAVAAKYFQDGSRRITDAYSND